MFFLKKIILALMIGGVGVGYSVVVKAAPVGRTVAAATKVTGSGPGGNRVIRAKSPIFSDDRLKANASGSAQIILIDKTRIVVGPGADLRIDDFVFDSNKSFSKLVITASKGAFRFISGKSKSSAYKIVTPTATIGVRGTALDITIRRDGSHIALLSGALRVCDRRGRCKNVRSSCEYLYVGRRGLSRTGGIGKARNSKLIGVFPLIENQRHLRRSFRKIPRGCTETSIKNAAQKPTPPAIPKVVARLHQPKSRHHHRHGIHGFHGKHGNPGNAKGVGHAGRSPGPGNFGGRTSGKGHGKGDANGGRGRGQQGHSGQRGGGRGHGGGHRGGGRGSNGRR